MKVGVRPFLRVWTAALLLWALPAQGQWVDPSRNWRTFDTANFSLHFAEENRPQARVVAGIAETVYARVTGWLQWRPGIAHAPRAARLR